MKRITLIASLLIFSGALFASTGGSVSDKTSEYGIEVIDDINYDFNQMIEPCNGGTMRLEKQDGLPSMYVQDIQNPAVPTFDKKTLRMWLYHRNMCITDPSTNLTANSTIKTLTALKLPPLA